MTEGGLTVGLSHAGKQMAVAGQGSGPTHHALIESPDGLRLELDLLPKSGVYEDIAWG